MRLTYRSRAVKYLEAALISERRPFISQYAFFRMLQRMYIEGDKLYLRSKHPNLKERSRLIKRLFETGLIRYDRDYGHRLLRILEFPVRLVDEAVCSADPLCYVSHLSAMQRWGLTDRSPRTLICTHPHRASATRTYAEIMAKHPYDLPPPSARLRPFVHPETVRDLPLRMHQTRRFGDWVDQPDTCARIATIGQTFLDMLTQPFLCGGMSHVMDIFDEYAATWVDEIVSATEVCDSKIIKCRTGYMLEERLGIHDERIESWKKLAQRGGSRKLDPIKDYAPDYSKTWMISINV